MLTLSRNSLLKLLAISLLLIPLTAGAAKPGSWQNGSYIWNGNNYPSGAHYNLNIHGKKDTFVCPDAEYEFTITAAFEGSEYEVGDTLIATSCPLGYICDQGDQVFGNVINIPRDTNGPVSILMESGRKGPKNAPETATLEVTDWCSGFSQNDSAALRIPKDGEGYMVFARITGKPSQDGETPSQIAVNGCFQGASDENGNDMVLLGLINTEGSFVPDCSNGTTQDTVLTRFDSGGKGKGAKKATNITGLFEWSGDVCYLNDQDEYCGDGTCTPLHLCCTDNNEDTIYDHCTHATADEITNSVCLAESYDFITAQCRSYTDSWIFNIADFVEYLWGINNDGAYNFKVRFYPLSQQEWWPLPPAPAE